MKSRLVILASGSFVLFSLLVASVTYAHNEGTEEASRKTETKSSVSSDIQKTPKARSSEMPKKLDKLDTNRLRICKTKEKVIDTRMSSLIKLATTMLGKFSEIADRVQTYYASSGLVVSDYDTLVADVEAKKDSVEAALVTAQSHIYVFDCEGDNPKEELSQFRLDMQAVKTALHDYRKSVRALIVAVKGAITDEDDPSVSPTKSPTP